MATKRLVGGAVGLALAIAAAVGISGRNGFGENPEVDVIRPPDREARMDRIHSEGRMPELDGTTGWANTPPLTASELRGIDGHPPGDAHGIDVDDQGNGTITEPRLYQLIRQPAPVRDREFEIELLDPGAEVFSFTFG